jgi:hypothetical protein
VPSTRRGQAVSPLRRIATDVVVNNRLRRSLATAIASFKLSSLRSPVRLAAAKELQNSADESLARHSRRARQGVGRRDQESLDAQQAWCSSRARSRNGLAAVRALRKATG